MYYSLKMEKISIYIYVYTLYLYVLIYLHFIYSSRTNHDMISIYVKLHIKTHHSKFFFLLM